MALSTTPCPFPALGLLPNRGQGWGLFSKSQSWRRHRVGLTAGELALWSFLGVWEGVDSTFNKDQTLKGTIALMVEFQGLWEAEEHPPRPWAKPACSLKCHQGSEGCRAGAKATLGRPLRPRASSHLHNPHSSLLDGDIEGDFLRLDCWGACLCPVEDKRKSCLLYYSFSKQQELQRGRGRESTRARACVRAHAHRA